MREPVPATASIIEETGGDVFHMEEAAPSHEDHISVEIQQSAPSKVEVAEEPVEDEGGVEILAADLKEAESAQPAAEEVMQPAVVEESEPVQPALERETVVMAEEVETADDEEAVIVNEDLKPVSHEPAAVEKSAKTVSAEDIEALLASNAPKAEPATSKQEESATVMSPDNIEALLAANAPKAEPAPAKKEEPAMAMSPDDIEAILAANAPKVEPAPAKKEEPAMAMGQDDIEALLAANAPKAELANEVEAIAEPNGQDDIDSLLQAYAPASGHGAQDDIDALLASTTKSAAPAAEAKEAPAKKEGEIISQSDLDALFAQATAPTPAAAPQKEEAQEREEAPYISQDDIDSILAVEQPAVETVSAAPAEAPTAAKADDGLLTQDTLDALLMDVEEGQVEKAAETLAPSLAESHDDELDKLLRGDEEGGVESLFESGDTAQIAAPGGGGPSLDEMLITETKSVVAEPAPRATFTEKTMVIPPPLEEEEEEELPLDRRIQLEHEAEMGTGGMKMPAFILSILEIIKGIIRKIPLPRKLPFKLPAGIPSLKGLSPRAAGILAGAGIALILAVGGGGYLIFSSGKGAVKETVATKEEGEKEVTGEGKEAAQKPQVQQAAVKATGPNVKLGVFMPVDFDSEASKIMSMDVELVFDSDIMAGAVRERSFFTAVTIENQIDAFFRDKFYEETVFAQDKLEEYLVQNLKAVQQFAGLKDVKLSNFTVE